MRAIGIVFIYDRKEGTPDEISNKFSDFFPSVGENLVTEKLIDLVELKQIMDNKRIFWGGVKENFTEIMKDEDNIGKLAWKIFNDFSRLEPSEEVKSLVYESRESPWNFPLTVNVLYE